jgi:hypothetical protein
VLTHRKARGGRDLHGLTLVAILFLSGSFLALDELVVLWPGMGPYLVPLAVAWAALKMKFYSTLPGMNLPARYRWTITALLAGSSLSPLLGDLKLRELLGTETARNIGWMGGWVSCLACATLVFTERDAAVQHGKRGRPYAFDTIEVLQTRWCGGWAVLITLVLGCLHLIASDWIFDRKSDYQLFVPMIIAAAAAFQLREWFLGTRVTSMRIIKFAIPSVLSVWLWFHGNNSLTGDVFTPAAQILFASAAFYLAMAWGTGRREFYIGLAGPLLALPAKWAWVSRAKAFIAIVGGFVLLGLGVAASLLRDKLLSRLDPPSPPEPPAPEPPAAPPTLPGSPEPIASAP